MSKYKFLIVQDGIALDKYVEKKFNKYFTYRDISSNMKGNFINFVGFIFTKNKALVSFPKHFFTKKELKNINQNPNNLDSYLSILYSVIQKCMSSNNNRLEQVRQELNQSYPFEPFLKIYRYYQTYGLFTREKKISKFGTYGKILWKDTFKKSPMLINQGNLLFWPPVVREYISDYVFISKCMAYVINNTIEKFRFIFNFKRVNLEYRDINLMNHKKIIDKLRRIKQHLFKDIHLELIDDLIAFFIRETYSGDQLAIKIYSFYLIWEEMVNYYLNNYFLTVDVNNDELIFTKTSERKNNFQRQVFELDARRNIRGFKTYKIIPDYYYDTEDSRYIFDAKYYTTINELDYKQLSYYLLLKNYQNENQRKIYNALILPTAQEQFKKIHFHLDNLFIRNNEELKILEYYLNMQEITKLYIR